MTQHSPAFLQHVEDDPVNLPRTLDPFTVTTSNGFMPLQTPQTELPKAFDPMIKLVERMPIVKEDGTPGLLASYQLGPTIDLSDALPDLTDEIDKLLVDGKPDLVAATAIFRDYSFLASAYLLEPCWEKWSKDSQQGYGLGRQRLPRNLAGPLAKAGKLINMPPFMSYVAYSTYNYRFADPSIGTSKYDNLRLVRAFEYGLDPASSEAGFVLTHVDMVKHSPDLIKGAVDMLNSVSANAGPEDVSVAFHHMLDAMQRIEASMETMWANSRPKDYIQYRTFIFGITNQSMFPNGVVYEGENNEEPMSFRGESGANDSIIPLLDNLLQIPMPQNPLTNILKDFRSYRPKPHREFLEYVQARAEEVGVREHCCKDAGTAVLYLRLPRVYTSNMKLFVVVLAFAALASAEYVVKTRENLLEFRNECVQKLSIPAETVEKFKKWDFEDTPIVHKYFECIFEKFGFYTKEGGFNVGFIHKQVDPTVTHEHHGVHNDVHAKIENCANSIEKNDAYAYNAGKCFIKENLQLVQKSVN